MQGVLDYNNARLIDAEDLPGSLELLVVVSALEEFVLADFVLYSLLDDGLIRVVGALELERGPYDVAAVLEFDTLHHGLLSGGFGGVLGRRGQGAVDPAEARFHLALEPHDLLLVQLLVQGLDSSAVVSMLGEIIESQIRDGVVCPSLAHSCKELTDLRGDSWRNGAPFSGWVVGGVDFGLDAVEQC